MKPRELKAIGGRAAFYYLSVVSFWETIIKTNFRLRNLVQPPIAQIKLR